MRDKKLVIALLGTGFGWGGGVDFLRNIANALLEMKKQHDLSVYLLLPEVDFIASPLDLLRMVRNTVRDSLKSKKLSLALPRLAFGNLFADFPINVQGEVTILSFQDTPRGLLRCLKRIGASVVFPVKRSLGDTYPIPWIGWIPDFQHKYYPKNFDARECFARDTTIADVLRDAKAVIVYSVALRNDINRFFPYTQAQIITLPFSPIAVPEWYDDENHVVKEYCLPERYFLLSNQFWIHKDHLTAFRALLKIAEVCDVSIVCTGHLKDYRRAGYAEELKIFLSANKLERRVQLLGHIPKRDQIEIMKRSLGVLQPTLFEGSPGGMSVCDAVSMGIPVIMSDIEVNREVQADNVFLFKAGDNEDLADKMTDLLGLKLTPPSKDILIRSAQESAERLGDALITAIEHVVKRV